MPRVRLAVAEPPEYTAVRDNFIWPDHAARTFVTGALIAWLAPSYICDPACGDASVLEAAYKLRPFKHATLADISEPQIAALQPSFPATWEVGDLIDVIADTSIRWDCVILTEILEHLEEPEYALRHARAHAGALVASVPIGDPEHGGNHEHLWSWDEASFESELLEAGWSPIERTTVILPGVNGNSQIWVAR